MDTFAPLLTQSGGIREIEKTQYQQLYGYDIYIHQTFNLFDFN